MDVLSILSVVVMLLFVAGVIMLLANTGYEWSRIMGLTLLIMSLFLTLVTCAYAMQQDSEKITSVPGLIEQEGYELYLDGHPIELKHIILDHYNIHINDEDKVIILTR